MKRFGAVAMALFLLLIAGSQAFAAEYVLGEAIVALKISAPQGERSVAALEAAVEAQAAIFAKAADVQALGTYTAMAIDTGVGIVHVRSTGKTTEQLMEELRKNPQVKSVQPNYIMKKSKVPNDPYYASPVSGNIVQWAPQHMGAPGVWDISVGSSDVVVAVIDSGIDYRHPDLAANMASDSTGSPGRRFYSAYTYSEDIKGVVSIDPRSDADPDPVKAKTGGHGTHVAGIIGAVGDNGVGITGINWNVGLLAVNVFTHVNERNYEAAFISDTIAGIDYILRQKRGGLNIRVANMSIGSWLPHTPDDSPYAITVKAMSDAGIIVVIAAGNDAQDINAPDMGKFPDDKTTDYSGEKPYPACFRFDLTISVGAFGPSDDKSYYSNWGNQWVDIAAPGGSTRAYIGDPERNLANGILSTVPTALKSDMGVPGYDLYQGTSMAAPYVAGAAALLMSIYPDDTSAQIKARILNNASEEGVKEGYWKHGRLDLPRAVTPLRSPSGGGCATTPYAALLILIPGMLLFTRLHREARHQKYGLTPCDSTCVQPLPMEHKE